MQQSQFRLQPLYSSTGEKVSFSANCLAAEAAHCRSPTTSWTVRSERVPLRHHGPRDRKSTRLNSSHLGISYGGFCLKKKDINIQSNFVLFVSDGRFSVHQQPFFH